MVKVELIDVFVEWSDKEWPAKLLFNSGKRWYASVALKLKDVQAGALVAEWFYLIACSPEYLRKPLSKGPVYNSKYFVVQDELNLDLIYKEAQQRLDKVNANNWDSFYVQMNMHFLHED